MNHEHVSEEDLILHYHGEDEDALAVETRLEECPQCREEYGALQRALNAIGSLPVPERGADYGARVWERIETRLRPRSRRFWAAPWRWAMAGAAAVGLLAAAFLAGRYSPRAPHPGEPAAGAQASDQQVGERVLLVAMGDYLDRSQVTLIELANADPKQTLDISAAQERAAGLASETRLYRQTANQTGNAAISGVLDELERVLIDIEHEPSRIPPERLERLCARLKEQGILFKIRVLGSTVRGEDEPSRPATGKSERG